MLLYAFYTAIAKNAVTHHFHLPNNWPKELLGTLIILCQSQSSLCGMHVHWEQKRGNKHWCTHPRLNLLKDKSEKLFFLHRAERRTESENLLGSLMQLSMCCPTSPHLGTTGLIICDLTRNECAVQGHETFCLLYSSYRSSTLWWSYGQ